MPLHTLHPRGRAASLRPPVPFPFLSSLLRSRPGFPRRLPINQQPSRSQFRAHLTPACSGLATLAADARRYTALDSSERRVRAACQLADSRHAGSLLRTTGEPRRGRCEKGTGATASFASRSSSALPLASSSFAPSVTRPVASLLPPRLLTFSILTAPSLLPPLTPFKALIQARPRSAQDPGPSNAVFLSVPVEPSMTVPSNHALGRTRSPRRGLPGRPHPRSTATFHSLCLAVETVGPAV